MLREELILPMVRGKHVLDCGGIDHSFINEKQKSGGWLHAKICEHALSCIGIDILADRVSEVNRQGVYRFITANVEQLEFVDEFDAVVAGELIEHLYNPGLFLDGAWRSLKLGGSLILTTPNAKALSGIWHTLIRRQEVCHAEHTCYYSPQTLRYIVERHGFQIDMLQLIDRPASSWLKTSVRNALSRICPANRETIVLIATKTATQNKYSDKW